ncbi:MAG TPA: Ppx/GppA phosphatase family protein [Candidatus Nanopelagicaceae bacterium]|nr:Ppx/GppA phosphatase family protein [Candidatus Nanopelagicaceae bacterium]
MRLGVLDVGSNTVHLLVVDAHPGARPLPATSYKVELRLVEHLDDRGAISAEGEQLLVETIADAMEQAKEHGVEDVLAFATSALREAANSEELLARVRDKTGVDLQILAGNDEARFTFLAVRRWFGWSSGRMLVLDIGGGSLEIACGYDEEPDVAFSLPLGANRLTVEYLSGDPFDPTLIRELRRKIRIDIAGVVPEVLKLGEINHPVATSKTFRSLARICGAEPSSAGAYVPRVLKRDVLNDWIPRLSAMPRAERSRLPGVSIGRANQLLAGALVAQSAMELLDLEVLEICPWALREGIILRRLDWMEG